eukprot:5625381-Prymnesium_polylepis.1
MDYLVKGYVDPFPPNPPQAHGTSPVSLWPLGGGREHHAAAGEATDGAASERPRGAHARHAG